MQEQEYRQFNQELAYLGSLPGTEVHMHPYFIELPMLAQVFRHLQDWRDFKAFNWLIFSCQHKPASIRMALDRRTVVFYMANEHGVLPEFSDQVGCLFTPDFQPKLYGWPPPQRVHLIPLGCNGDVPEVPWIPWEARKLDVFYSGQVLPQRAGFIRQAIQLLFDLRSQSHLMAQIQLTPRFRNGMTPLAYAQALMDSRIAPVPPGISPITLRLFEAMRSGCILFSQQLPPYWYLKGLPQVLMKPDWQDFSPLVLELLADQGLQQELHVATRQHYQTHCTPEAIARYVREQLLL